MTFMILSLFIAFVKFHHTYCGLLSLNLKPLDVKFSLHNPILDLPSFGSQSNFYSTCRQHTSAKFFRNQCQMVKSVVSPVLSQTSQNFHR